MTDIYIRHKSQNKKYLKYNHEIGPVAEVDSGSMTGLPYSKACYTILTKGFLGVVGSMTGPFLFTNEEKFDFADLSWSVNVVKGKAKNTFYLLKYDIEVLTEEYVPPSIDVLDPWSDEESEDFFIWLESKRTDEEFIEMWTLV